MKQFELHASSSSEGIPPLIDIDDFKSVTSEVQDYAIVLLDINGNILSWNKGAELIKGYILEEIIGRNFRIFLFDRGSYRAIARTSVGNRCCERQGCTRRLADS
jgi:PAS domain S-box-containing protein